jgi:lysyl-tRNA synthetase class 2
VPGGPNGPCTVSILMSDDPDDGGPPNDPEPSAADIRTLRLQKLERLRAEGVNVYPYRFDRDRTIAELRADFGHLGAGEETDVEVRIAGRLMLKREQGRLTFATLRDRDGEVQLFVSQGVLGKERFGVFNDLDRGDWVGAAGTVMVTKKGELSVKVTGFELLSKALRPLPDKWKGLSDTDQRYRQRYVDLVVNDEARAILMVRIAAVQAIRDRLRDQGYLEVETPVLNLIQSGATARPFVTHYNALDLDSYLRIALELPLKRLIVGGMEKVFEIGRIFRNEGLDTRHNPEFTMLETYEAFVDYTEMMALLEDLVSNAARAAIGTTEVTVRGQTVSLAPPYRRATMIELIRTYADVDVHPSMPPDELRAVLDSLDVSYDPAWGSGKLVMELYDAKVEPELIAPTFVLDYPREVSPLAKAHRDDPELVERFELVVGGRELANAYSELNDPVDQLERFRHEAALKAAGDPEAGDVDLDYVRALEYGMPPAGGMGIGIDRLTMLLAEVETIREVILFPTLRPESGLDEAEFEVLPPSGQD